MEHLKKFPQQIKYKENSRLVELWLEHSEEHVLTSAVRYILGQHKALIEKQEDQIAELREQNSALSLSLEIEKKEYFRIANRLVAEVKNNDKRKIKPAQL